MTHSTRETLRLFNLLLKIAISNCRNLTLESPLVNGKNHFTILIFYYVSSNNIYTLFAVPLKSPILQAFKYLYYLLVWCAGLF